MNNCSSHWISALLSADMLWELLNFKTANNNVTHLSRIIRIIQVLNAFWYKPHTRNKHNTVRSSYATVRPVNMSSEVCTLCCLSSFGPPKPEEKHSVVPLSQIQTRRDIRSFTAFPIKATASLWELRSSQDIIRASWIRPWMHRKTKESPSAPHYCCRLALLDFTFNVFTVFLLSIIATIAATTQSPCCLHTF